MSDIVIGVVGDMRRNRQAYILATGCDAKVLSLDEGILGCTKNHIKVWTKLLQHGGNWGVVLEDDAAPCEDFLDQLAAVLANPPCDVVSLYLGRSYPRAWQRFIKKALIDPDAHWITSTHVLHGVGLAIRMHLVEDMLRFIGNMAAAEQDWPIDEQITHWCRLRGHAVAYTRPSIVDHGDGESLVEHRDGAGRELPRHAWEFGTREKWNPELRTEMP